MRRALVRAAAVAATALLFASHSAKAANGADTWVGNTSADWNGSNWMGANNPPISGDSLVFGADGTAGLATTPANTLTNTLTSTAFNINGITFNSGAPAYTMTGNTFNLTAGITNNSGVLQTFTNTGVVAVAGSTGGTVSNATGLTLSAGTTWNVGTGGITVSGLQFNITNNAQPTTTVNGTGGTLTIGYLGLGTNTNSRLVDNFAGTGNISVGTMAPGGSASLVSDSFSYGGTGTFTLTGSHTGGTFSDAINSGTFVLSGNEGSGLGINNAAVFTETSSGVLSGSAAIAYNSTATTSTLAGANTLTGAITVSAGALTLSGSINASNATSGSNIVVNGGTFNETSTGVLNGSGSGTTAGGQITLNSGAVNLQGANNTTGNITVNGGTLTVDSTGGTTANVLKTNGVTLTMGNGTTNFLLSNNATANTETLYQTAFTANTSSLVEVTQNGNTGTAGVINLDNTSAFGRGAASIVDFGTLPTGGTVLESTASKANFINGVLTSGTAGVAFATVGGGTNFASINTSTGVIGTVAPTTGTYSATANVSVTGGDTPASAAGANTLTFAGTSGAALNLSGINTITAGGILVTPSTTGATTITGGTIRGGAGKELVVINNEPNTAGALTISSIIADSTSGSSALTIGSTLGATGIAANPQRTVLSAANTFTGQTTLLSGTLDLSNQLALQNSTLQLNTGAALVFDSSVSGNAFTLGGLSTNNNIALLNNASTPAPINLTVGGNNSTTTIGGVISGAGGTLTKIGTGTLSLTANDTYTGLTTVTGGTLAIGSTTGITSNVAVGTGAFLSLSRNASESATIGASSIISGTGGLIENVNNPNQSITLDRPNTYSGPTQNPARGGFTAGIASTFDGSGNQLTGAFGVNSQLQFTSGNAVLALNGYANQVGSLSSTAGSGVIVLGGLSAGRPASVLTIGGDNATANYQGIIAESANQNSAFGTGGTFGGSIVKIGTGDQTFSGSNLYAGATTIKGGTLTVTTLTNGGVATTASAADAASTTLSVSSTAGLVVGQSLEATGLAIGTPPTITSIGTNSVTLSAAQTIANGTPLYFGNGNGLGISTNAAASLALDGGTLQYTGATASTDRLFTVGSNEAGGATGTLDASGTGALNFTNTGAIAYGTTGQARTLGLTGTSTAANTLAALIGDNGAGPVSVTKSGTGSWTLTNANTYTGATTVNGGTLSLAKAGTAGSATGGTLGASTVLNVNTGGRLLVAASNAVGNTTPVNLGGGTFSAAGGVSQGAGAHTSGGMVNSSPNTTTGGTVSGSPATSTLGLGALTLSGNSTLNFAGSGVSTLVFTSFNPNPGASNFTLNVTGYATTVMQGSGSSGTDGTDDRIIFDQQLTPAQLSDITFYGAANATQVELDGGFYEVIGAVPEPSTWLGGLMVAGAVGYQMRRRLGWLGLKRRAA